MPGRNDAAHGSGAITSKRSPHQHTMSQQVRGSATPPDATKLVITARTSLADSQQRSGKPRSETQPQATTHQSRALPTHPDGAWRWTTQKQARRARVHAPERNDTERPSKFTKQRHPPRRHEARANSKERHRRPWSAATCPDGTRPERRIKFGRALHVSASYDLQAPSSARPRMPRSETFPVTKTHWRRALPGIKTTVFERHSP